MRPWRTIVLFALCLGIVLAALGWVTATVLRLERANIESQRRAAFEEIVRLALWRMDAAVSPLIMEENARPYFEYMAFSDAGTVNPNRLNSSPQNDLVPSPLLFRSASNVNVYFNGTVDAQGNGVLVSPQVPTGRLFKLAVENYHGIDREITRNDRTLKHFLGNVGWEDLATNLASSVSHDAGGDLANRDEYAVGQIRRADKEGQQAAQMNQPFQVAAVPQGPDWRNTVEYTRRAEQTYNAQKKVVSSKRQMYETQERYKGKDLFMKGHAPDDRPGADLSKSGSVQRSVADDRVMGSAETTARDATRAAAVGIDESIMRPFWVGDMLLLARRVEADGRKQIQGAWLNWPVIRKDLLAEIADILPRAGLVPARSSPGVRLPRLMASLPVRLIPGEPAALPPPISPPLRAPLIVAWFCVILAAGSVAALLAGAISLSERRGAFVSAVTHEMRTPLTTFRMYSEMLAEDMVRDEEKKRHYLRTLCVEGDRLSHLVENVLSFARLERGSARKQVETMFVTELVNRVEDRLRRHAEQSGMNLVVETSPASAGTQLKTDVSAVDQILFNLVDNACKYAGAAADRRIHLRADRRGHRIAIGVCDHGPGISRRDAGILFKPFRKSAQHAAESAPGVGLGLALSRRLARQIGGNLALDRNTTDGACFELLLPVRDRHSGSAAGSPF